MAYQKYKRYPKPRAYRKKSDNQVISFIVLGTLVAGLASVVPFLNQVQLNTQFYVIVGSIIAIFVVLIGGVLLFLIERQRQRRLRALQMTNIDMMSGIEFEQYVGELIKFQGYTIDFTPGSNDYGIDIVARRDGIRYAIQIKRYKNMLDNTPIQEAMGGIRYYNCDKALVVTNNYFTQNAKNLAEVNNCTLIDRDILTEWMVAFQDKKVKKLF